MARKKVVIIEDERDISETIAFNLRREGYQVWLSEDGESGLRLVSDNRPDVVLLDLMLPGMDGEEVCRQIRSDRVMRETYVIMTSAKGDESDIVLGLGLGADDYVPKPFSVQELLARVRSVQRRGRLRDPAGPKSRLSCGPLEIDPLKYEVLCEGRPVALTATEFRVLSFLVAHPDRVFSRDQILNHAIGIDAMVIDRNIDVHINSIRRKLACRANLIQTVRGVGYRLSADEPT